MRTSRRGLLATAAAGLVVAAPAAAWGPVDAAIAAKAKRCKCVPAGEFELLARKVEDLKAQVRGLSARLTNTGFAPAALLQNEGVSSPMAGITQTSITMPFAGSLISMSVDYGAAVDVGATATATVRKNGAATAAAVTVSAGGTSGSYGPTGKGEITFNAGDVLDIVFSETGTAFGSSTQAQTAMWVSFN